MKTILAPIIIFMTSSVELKETELIWKTMWQESSQPVAKQKVIIEEFDFDTEKVEFKAKLKRIR